MRILRDIASFVSWHRRAMGALLAVASVLLLAQSLAAPPSPTVEVVALSADVSPGQQLAAGDLTIAHLPAEGVPDGALTALDDAIGQIAAAGVGKGTVLQPGLLAGAQSVEPGRAVVPIAVRDAQLRALLRPGDRVTLVMVGAETADVLTSDARVSVLPKSAPSSGLSVGSGGAEGLVMVDVPAEQAPTVAALGQGGQLSVILGGL